MDRRPTSFTLTGFCRALLKQLSSKLGVSQTAIIEMAVRDKAKKEEIQVEERRQ